MLIKYISYIFCFLIMAAFIQPACAMPREIVLIRHADKLSGVQNNGMLTAVGYARAVKFAFYFLKTFGRPDVLIATNPSSAQYDMAIRELQTLAPLSNILAEKKSQNQLCN